MAYKVLDLSKYNIVSDWNAVAKDIDAVIIRAGYRGYSNGGLTVDDRFKSHIENAKDRNIPLTVYFFSQAINEAEAKEEANFCVSLIKDYKISMPIFIDSEYSNKDHNGRADKLSKAVRTAVTVAFCEEIKAKGYKPGVYASDSWFKDNLDLSKLTGYSFWVARYSSKKPENVSNYIGWQYTDVGKVNGIATGVDLSHWYDENINGSTTQAPAEKPTTPSVSESTTVTDANFTDGQKVVLNNVNLYASSTTAKPACSKSGTYYIWSKDVTNGRVRITNSEANAKKSGCVTGWIEVADIVNKSDNEPPVTNAPAAKRSFKAGMEVVLNNVPFYVNSTTTKASATKSGTYWIWSDSVSNDRIRITNNASKAGVAGYVTAWVNIDDIS